jgi:predicted metal-dependent hydrolase
MHPLLKFTLDIFEPNRPLAHVIPAQAAIKTIASSAQTTASFRHPRANRDALLSGTVVAFEFKRGKRRTIGFSVGPQGLVVRAPSWVPLHQVDAALQEKSRWIIQKLGETAARHQRRVAHDIEWRDGMVLPYIGQQLTVLLDPNCVKVPRGVAAALLLPTAPVADDAGLAAHQPTLRLSLPSSATPDQMRAAVQAWLMRQVKQHFIERLDHFAPQLQVQWRTLALSNAKTRWGSARIDGSIRLNWRLVHFDQAVIDYVVVHELSHLRVMDHSPRFWDTVRSVVPDYAALRQQLKDETTPRWA